MNLNLKEPLIKEPLVREVPSNTCSISNVFDERLNNYLHIFKLFAYRFNKIPHYAYICKVDCLKANNWFMEYYKNEIKESLLCREYFLKSKTYAYRDTCFFIYEDTLINFDICHHFVSFLFKNTDISAIEMIIKGMEKFMVKNAEKEMVNLIIRSNGGFELEPFHIIKPKLSIRDNYNDDFLEVHKLIKKRISKKNEKGIVLLHGKPGTGKTSYIRYLISDLKKQVIIFPVNMAYCISDPDFMKFLIRNPDSVLVIEDAENVISHRDKEQGSNVSSLLNLTDGLLSDCLNIQVICTFNTDLKKIDSALQRKGRLIARYEFKELTVGKTKKLSEKLGFESKEYTPMTLAEIYNQTEKSFQTKNEKRKIGF